jgi:hypothetical protein
MDLPHSSLSVFVLVLVVIFCIVYFSLTSHKQGRNLPNGSPGLPIFGNIFDFRGTVLHFKLTEWSRQYGGIFAYKVGQAPVVVLNSPEALQDLYVKKGQIYSSKPRVSNQASLITQGARIVNMPYGDLWRVCDPLAAQLHPFPSADNR